MILIPFKFGLSAEQAHSELKEIKAKTQISQGTTHNIIHRFL